MVVAYGDVGMQQWSELFHKLLFLLNLTGGDRRCKRTNDRQTCTKLGPGVLGAWMETHSSLVASFLLYSLSPYSFTVL
jgi:hypothetical protein